MYKKTENKTKEMLAALGAWAMVTATLVGMTDVARVSRPVAVNFARPAYAYANDDMNLWNRNDNENETVHLPTKFDIGLQMATVGGKR